MLAGIRPGHVGSTDRDAHLRRSFSVLSVVLGGSALGASAAEPTVATSRPRPTSRSSPGCASDSDKVGVANVTITVEGDGGAETAITGDDGKAVIPVERARHLHGDDRRRRRFRPRRATRVRRPTPPRSRSFAGNTEVPAIFFLSPDNAKGAVAAPSDSATSTPTPGADAEPGTTTTTAPVTADTFWLRFWPSSSRASSSACCIALAAIGVSLIYGTTGLNNFAHGEMVTFGALMALPVLRHPRPARCRSRFPSAMILGGAFGWAQDAGIWRPLRKRGPRPDPADDRHHRPLARAALHLPVLLRRPTGSRCRQHQAVPRDRPRSASSSPTSSARSSPSSCCSASPCCSRDPDRQGHPRGVRQPGPRLRIRHQRRPRHPHRLGRLRRPGRASPASTSAYYQSLRWDTGASILLLIFAAVTLGGLGTAFGALVGSLVIGLIVEVSTLWIPATSSTSAALVAHDHHPARPTAGHPRPQRANRLGKVTMNWQFHLARNRADLRPRPSRPTRWRPSASPSTSASPACSTSARRASWPSAPTPSPSPRSIFGWPLWAVDPRGDRRGHRLRVHPRHPDAATAGGLPAIVTIAAAEIVRLLGHDARVLTTSPAARTASTARRGRSTTVNPLPEGRYGFGTARPTTSDQWWVRIVGWTLVALACLLVCLLMRSPWGRVIKGIREDEDAVRSPRQERLLLQDAGAHPRWRVRRARPGSMFVLPRSLQPDNYGT